MPYREIVEELTIMKGGQVIQNFQIFENDDVLTIGRHYLNDIGLPDDPKVSRVHAALIRYEPDEKTSFFLRDLGSAHGTKISDKFVHKRLLKKGDVIRICEYTIRFGNKENVQENIGIPFDERFISFPSEGGYKMKTFIQDAPTSFTDEQEEFLFNLGSLGLSDEFPEEPELFLDQLLDVMKAQKGILGYYGDSEIFIKSSVGCERRSPQLLFPLSKNFSEVAPSNKTLHYGYHFPGIFLALIRTQPPAFKSDDLCFVERVKKQMSDLKTFADNLFERTEWPNEMIGLADLKDKAGRIAELEDGQNNDILITGETGTGKEVLANYIHKQSPRKNNPFEARNCANFTKELVGSELFGHLRGAFSGANEKRSGAFRQAEKGVLFLDEIAELPENIQTVLLRALQERKMIPVGSDRTTEFDLRVIAATNSDLEKDIADGLFRRDLYERFPHKISIPPLRERKEDIVLLAYYFLDKYSQKTQSISREAMACLRQYDWPHNIRELQNVMKSPEPRNKKIIFSWDLPDKIRSVQQFKEFKKTSPKTLKEIEKERIVEVLEETRGNINLAAKILGISRASVYNKINKYDIPSDYGKN